MQIMSYGVFVTINDSNRSGLLHVRNISKDMVQYPDVFHSLHSKQKGDVWMDVGGVQGRRADLCFAD